MEGIKKYISSGNKWRNYVLALVLLGSFTISSAQITGVVTDALTGDALIGVNITLKSNDQSGTISDIDGKYSIQAAAGDIIVFSYVGFEPVEAPVGTQTTINIQMKESTELLEEVVVIGYGAVVKKDLTGSVTKIGEKEFNEGSLTSPIQLLNGKIAGLQISDSGEPGGGARFRLRGGTGLDASSEPLIVIDGIVIDNRGTASGRNPLNFINTSDIESVTVLKDASAAAIYGSRGANGVIIVTTKTGKNKPFKINYDGNASVSAFAGDTKILDAANFRNAINAKAPQEFEFLGDENTDWVKEITQNAISTEHNLSISGSKNNYNYMISGGYLKANGVLKTSSHESKSILANLGTELFDNRLKINISSKTGFTNDVFTPNVLGAALTFDPTRPVLDDNTEFGGYYQWPDILAVNNPVATINLTDHRGSETRTLNSISFEYALPYIEGLSLTSNMSYDYIKGEKRNLKDPLLKEGTNIANGGSVFDEELRNFTAQIETFGTYKRALPGIKSSLTLTAGHSWLRTDQENRWNTGSGLELVDGVYQNTQDLVQDSFLTENKLISFFGRANFTYNEKYLIQASLRRDGSSRFGLGNEWGTFPSVAVGWRILEEDFASGLTNIFDNLKLRVSYGVTGNEQIGDFLYNIFYAYGTDDAAYQFGDDFINTLRGKGVDPNIKWEETRSTNIGLDFGFMNNRFSGTLDFYQKQTSDLLFTVATSAFTNLADRVLTNIGEMENKGVELTLNTVAMDREDWDWNIGFNVAYNSNEIKKLDNSNLPDFLGYEAGGISGDIGQTIQILKVGESIESFRTYQHLINADGTLNTDNVDWNDDGVIDRLDMYADINNDGQINENDLVINRTAAPDFIFGLTSLLRYKRFNLSTTIRSQIGNYVYNNVASSTGFFDRLSDRVTNNVHESAFVVNFKEQQLKSDYYIENAAFVRLDNITLGYDLPGNSIFSNLKIYTTVSNVYTLTGYSGLDPEVPQFNGGIDNNIYPTSRRYLLGLNAAF